jgi:hypothetical protein
MTRFFFFLIKLLFSIDVKILDDLIQFGYSESRACKALVQSNNNFNLALDVSFFFFVSWID